MFNEVKILFENIKNFRHLLTEGVGDKVIVDAINEHKYLYIYYKGEGTIETGYRTIRPFVLGTTSKGNLAVRAWQDKGRSDSLRADSPRNRLNHEHHTDSDGATKAGWRLFLVDNITSAYPTGKKFNDINGNVMIPPLYNENDEQMTNIVASISATPDKEIQAKDSGDTSVFKTQTSKWQSFNNANVNSRKPKAVDIENLANIAKKVMKKSINNYFVAINDKNEFSIQDVRVKSKFPQNAIVGDLANLYDKLVRKVKPTEPEQDKFFKQKKELFNKDTAEKQNNTNKQGTNTENVPLVKENDSFPIVRKTFFKT